MSPRQAPIAAKPTDRGPVRLFPNPTEKYTSFSIRGLLRRLPAPEVVQKWVWTQFEHQTAQPDPFRRARKRDKAPPPGTKSHPRRGWITFFELGRAPTRDVPGKR